MHSKLFSPSAKAISSDDIDIEFHKDEVTILAINLTSSPAVTMTITDESGVQTITDWKLDSGGSHKSSNVAAFTAKLISDQAKQATYTNGTSITITIAPSPIAIKQKKYR